MDDDSNGDSVEKKALQNIMRNGAISMRSCRDTLFRVRIRCLVGSMDELEIYNAAIESITFSQSLIILVSLL